jgi:hypothetical protein
MAFWGRWVLAAAAALMVGGWPGCRTPVATEPPQLVVDADTLQFDVLWSEKSFAVANGGGGELVWRLSVPDDATWCVASPDSGSSGDRITVRVDRSGLALGDYESVISIGSNGGVADVLVLVSVGPTGTISINTPLPE